ncbi:hypothetical protein QBC45DRAFT_432684 [Copromyces sp. CBS 386.78]|nr:hypothetical protein QBC45DRAFT_432684 [Copromyces sp. CBS 386.78]
MAGYVAGVRANLETGPMEGGGQGGPEVIVGRSLVITVCSVREYPKLLSRNFEDLAVMSRLAQRPSASRESFPREDVLEPRLSAPLISESVIERFSWSALQRYHTDAEPSSYVGETSCGPSFFIHDESPSHHGLIKPNSPTFRLSLRVSSHGSPLCCFVFPHPHTLTITVKPEPSSGAPQNAPLAGLGVLDNLDPNPDPLSWCLITHQNIFALPSPSWSMYTAGITQRTWFYSTVTGLALSKTKFPEWKRY